MRVGFFVAGGEETASVRFRALAYRPFLERAGIFAEVHFPKTFALGHAFSRVMDIFADIAAAGCYDVVVLQRKCFPPPAARLVRRRARRLVFDFDDAIWMPPPGHPHGRDPWRLRRYEENFGATLHGAHAAVAGNSYLAEHARPLARRVEVVPTGLDLKRWTPLPRRPDAMKNGPVLGWVGHESNLPELEALASAWRELARCYPGFRLRVVSGRAPRMEDVPLEFVPWSLVCEREVFEGLDIGLMPMADNAWTRGKCAFKGIQYMACGIPCIASPAGENSQLIAHEKNGLLASSPEEWVRAVARLAEDGALRERLAGEGRATVEERYNLEKMAPRWIRLLQEITASSP